MANTNEIFTRRFGGGKRSYYLDVKRDAKGDNYIVISESSRKDDDTKMRTRVMVWKEDFRDLFTYLREMEAFVMEAEAQRDSALPSDDVVPIERAANGYD